jgi:hypothetical protein
MVSFCCAPRHTHTRGKKFIEGADTHARGKKKAERSRPPPSSPSTAPPPPPLTPPPVCDPAHVNFTHSGVQGNRKAEKGTVLKVNDRPTSGGFSFFQLINRPGVPQGAAAPRVDVRFTAPCLVRYDFPFVSRSMIVYVVPTGVGKSRMLARFLKLPSAGAAAPSSFAATAVDGAKKDDKATAPAPSSSSSSSSSPSSSSSSPPRPQKPPLLRRLLFGVFAALEATPVLEHALVRNAVLDGDNYIIHAQERILAQRAERPEALDALARAEALGGGSAVGGGSSSSGQEQGGDGAAVAAAASPSTEPWLRAWRRQYWMPGQFDAGVQLWRAWLQGPGRELPTRPRKAADLGPVLPRREALDRLSQHTQICRPCSDALAAIDGRWLPGLAAAAALLFAGALWAAGVKAAAAIMMAGGGGGGGVAGGGGAAAADVWASAVAAAAREPAVGILVALAAAALLARRMVSKFREQLIFVDYVHADKN